MSTQREPGPRCPSGFVLDRLLAGEPSADDTALERHIADCERCGARIAELRRAQARFAVLPEALVRRVHAQSAPRAWRVRWRRPLAAAGALLAFWATWSQLGSQSESLAVRTKGGTHVTFYVMHDGAVRPGLEGERVHPGDALQFVYASDRDMHLAIVSIDGSARPARTSTKMAARRRSPAAGAACSIAAPCWTPPWAARHCTRCSARVRSSLAPCWPSSNERRSSLRAQRVATWSVTRWSRSHGERSAADAPPRCAALGARSVALRALRARVVGPCARGRGSFRTTRRVDDNLLERIEYARLVRKGKDTVRSTSGPLAGYRLRSEITADTGLCHGLFAGYAFVLPSVTLTPRLEFVARAPRIRSSPPARESWAAACAWRTPGTSRW